MLTFRRDALCILCRALACCFAPACVHAIADTGAPDNGYQLGSGWQIPGTEFRIGGYAAGTYERQNDATPRVALDNLSMFLWWDGDGRWKLFSEFEYENLLFTRDQAPGHNGYLSLERAYVDFALTDNVNIRAGKFLTMIGRWNLIHATPLVWTTSRPLVTTLAFPTNMTGVMLSGTLPNIGNGIEYSLYGAGGSDLRTNPSIDPFSSAFGAHVTWTVVPALHVGFSYADFEQEKSRPERKQLAGVDFVWSHDRYELSGEIVYRFSDQSSFLDEKGAYLQFVAPLTEKLYAVARYETYRTARDGAPTELRVGGLNYRIRPTLVFKAEWVASTHNTVHAPDGLLTSINVLF